MSKHRTGKIEGYTSTRLPLRLVFYEQFPSREEALACERQIKGWNRKKEALIQGDWAEVSRLARRDHASRPSELVVSKAHAATAACEKSPSTLRLGSGQTLPRRAFSPELVEGSGRTGSKR